MRNMGAIIRAHNSRINSTSEPEDQRQCNCRDKEACPLQGKCLSKAIVYKATVSASNVDKCYVGLAGKTFKERYNNHTKSFRNKKYAKETELSKYVWDLQENNNP